MITIEEFNSALKEFKEMLASEEFERSANRPDDFYSMHSSLFDFYDKWKFKLLFSDEEKESNQIINNELKDLRRYTNSFTGKMTVADGIRHKDWVIHHLKQRLQFTSKSLGLGNTPLS